MTKVKIDQSEKFKNIAYLLFGFGLLFLFNLSRANASCTYSVSGNLKVRIQNDDLYHGQDMNLKGVQIKAETCAYESSFCQSMGTDETLSSDGSFEISDTRRGTACSNGRYIRVFAKFKDDNLSIYKNSLGSPDWHQIAFRTKGKCKNCNFGDLVYKKSGNYDRNDTTLRKHAEIWFRTQKAIHYINSDLGGDLKLTKRVQVVYPTNTGCVGSSYVMPATKVLHLWKPNKDCDEDGNTETDEDEDHFYDYTIFHELGHVWAFRHSSGESFFNGMGTYWCSHGGDTHGIVEKSRVAFHEGFAAYFSEQLKVRLGFITNTTGLTPYNRNYISKSGAGDFDTECEHDGEGSPDCLDDGWTAILTSLTMGSVELSYSKSNDLVDWDFNPSSETYFVSYDLKDYTADYHSRPSIDFEEVLQSFIEDEDAGYSKDLSSSEMNFDDFVKRLGDITEELDSDDIARFKILMDPTETAGPETIYLKSLLEISVSGNAKLNRYAFSGNEFVANLKVTIENTGDTASEEAWIYNYDEEFSGDQMTYVEALEAGEETTSSSPFYFTANSDGSFPLTTLEWSVATLSQESAGLIQDTYTLEVGPDYIPELSSSVDNDNLRDGSVSCTAKNDGNAPSGIESTLTLSVKIQMDGYEALNESNSLSIDSLGATGESSSVSIDFTTMDVLSHYSSCEITITCTSDSGSDFDELSESNNNEETVIDCGSRPSEEEEDPGFGDVYEDTDLGEMF